MSGWIGPSGPRKLFAGVSGTVTCPTGSQILHLKFVGGTLQMPDGQGSVVLITGTTDWFSYDPMHLNATMQGAGGGQLLLTFAGTTAYFVELQSKGGF
jgi:hypothetical protein